VKRLFFIYPVVIVILLIGTGSITKNRISRNLPVLQQNLLGDQLYGLTPDWVNFIKASQWAAKNLDENAIIISRKPSISKVYTGRNFGGAPGNITVPFDEIKSLKAAEGHTLLVIAEEENKGVFRSPSILYALSQSATSSNKHIIVNNKEVIGAFIYMIPDGELERVIEALNSVESTYTLDYTDFIESNQDLNPRILDLDKMAAQLIESGIDYILLAQLRFDPTQNTGVYINNLHIFVGYISYKYPERFKFVHSIGDQERCDIIQVIR
jgi:hypothetical protein